MVKTKHICQEDFDLIQSWKFLDQHKTVDLADPQVNNIKFQLILQKKNIQK